MAKLKPNPYSLSELKSLLDAEKQDALSAAAASKLSTDRQNAMDYYLGDVTSDLPTIPGRSKAVSMDVSDSVEGLMPNLMEIFTAGDEIVQFNPVGPEDVKAAEQETDYINHIFMQRNPGFLIIYTFCKDALLSKVGVVKVRWEQKETTETETYLDQSEDVFAIVASDPDVEIVEHATKVCVNPGDEMNPSSETVLHDFTVARKRTYGCAEVLPVPPEEFGISRNARNIKDCTYCFHEVPRIQSDLIAEGYDPDQVNTLQTYASKTSQTGEENARDTVDEGMGSRDFSLNKAARRVRVTEHYIHMDMDRDGNPRLWRITTGGEQSQVLTKDGEPDIVEEDYMPFAAMTPVIITHRFFGRSIADLVMDIQQIKTASIRALLDNAYLANNPRPVVSESETGEATIDDLLISAPGRPIRVKANAGAAIVWQSIPTIGQHIYPLVEYFDSTREWRTGVSRQGQGLNADALQNQSATAANQLYTAAQARIKLIARIFAETGIKDLFYLLHAVTRRYGQQADTVRLRNQWVTVDPRNWKTRNDLTVSVGLGTGSKTERLVHLQGFINGQINLRKISPAMVSDKNLYNSMAEYAKLIDMKTIEPYVTDPDSPQARMMAQMQQQQGPPPDPKVMEVQGKIALAQADSQAKIQREVAETLADMKAEEQKFAHEALLERQKFELDKQLRIEQHMMDMQERQLALRDRQGIVTDAMAPVSEMLGHLTAHLARQHESNTQHMATLADMIARTHMAAAAPRKTTLVRGADGRPSHAISAIDQPNGNG